MRKSYANMTYEDWDGVSRKSYPVKAYFINDDGFWNAPIMWISSYPNMEIANEVSKRAARTDYETSLQYVSNVHRRNVIMWNHDKHEIFIPCDLSHLKKDKKLT